MKIIIAIASLALLISCGTNPKKGQQMPITSYKCIKLDTTSTTIYKEFAAEILGDVVVDIQPRTQGYIDKIYVKEGARVKKGQKLFLIDNRDLKQMLASANASVNMGKASVANAELEVRKITPLVQKGITSPYELENAKSNLSSAKANLQYANAQRRNAEINLSFATITSPVDGVVGRITSRQGTLVSPTNMNPLTSVSGDEKMSAFFSFDEKYILDITNSNNNSSAITFPEAQLIMADGSIYPLKGEVSLASGLVDGNTGSLQVKANFDNPNKLLRSGSSGMIRINNPMHGIIRVPQKATFEIQDKRMVYTVSDSSTVVSQIITVLGEDNTHFIVKNELKPGDIILLEGVDFVRNGQKIAPKL